MVEINLDSVLPLVHLILVLVKCQIGNLSLSLICVSSPQLYCSDWILCPVHYVDKNLFLSLFCSHCVSFFHEKKKQKFRWKAALLRRGWCCWFYLYDFSSSSSSLLKLAAPPMVKQCNQSDEVGDTAAPVFYLQEMSEWADGHTEECVLGRLGVPISVEHLKAIYCTACILTGN